MDNDHRHGGHRRRGSYNGGRGGRGGAPFRKHPRDVPEPPQSPEAVLASMLFQIGDKRDRQTLENNIESIAQVIEEKDNKKVLLQLIIPIIFVQPVKTPFYGTLVGLLNAKNPQLGKDIVSQLHVELQSSIDNLDNYKLRLLLRYCVELIETRVLTSDSFVELLEKLFPLFSGLNDVAELPKCEFYLSIILDVLPFAGRMLFNRHKKVLFSLMELLTETIRKREKILPYATRKLLTIFHNNTRDDTPLSPDWIEDKWSRLNRSLIPNAEGNWSALTDESWEILDPLFLRTQKSYFAGILDAATPWPLPSVNIPEQKLEADYPRRLRSIFTIFPESDTEHELTPAGRSVLEQYIVDLMCSFNSSHKECVRHLLQLTFRARLDFLIIELLFGQLFELPTPPYKIIYYGTLIADFCKEGSTFAGILAAAVDLIFKRIDQLNAECFDRFSEWFSFHLSTFDWQWNWENWKHVLTLEPHAPQRRFVSETLEQCIRLSYFERIQRVLPAEFHVLLPPKPTVNYTLADSTLANALQEKIQSRETSEQIQEFLSISQFASQQEELAFFLQVLLLVGSKSYTHILKLFERYVTLLQSLTSDQQSKIVALSVVQQFWSNNHQNIIIIIDNMMTYRIVDYVSVTTWILSPKLESELHYGHLWIVLRKMFQKTLARENTIKQKLEQAERGDIAGLLEDDEDPQDGPELEILKAHKVHSLKQALDQATKEIKAVFSTAIIRFSEVLDSFTSDNFVVYRAKGHLFETLRANASHVKKLLREDPVLHQELISKINDDTAAVLEALVQF